MAGSPLLPTCGVGNCSCGGFADLPRAERPMCSVEGSGETASGVQLPLLAAAVGSTAAWKGKRLHVYAGWVRSDRDLVLVPQIMYHRPWWADAVWLPSGSWSPTLVV
eukprot:Skav223697  [mRNA]  locus=scaffold1907:170874:171968:+ [translate_table: standard]